MATAISTRQAQRYHPDYPFQLIILDSFFQPYGLIFQWEEELHSSVQDPLRIIEWVFLLHQFGKTISTKIKLLASLIIKGRQRLLALSSQDPSTLILPLPMQMLQWLLQSLLFFQTALEGFTGTVSIHTPGYKFLQSPLPLQDIPKCSPVPLDALTVFMDGSGLTGNSVIIWRDTDGRWQSDVHVVKGSPQIVELAAVVRVFEKWSCLINIVTDSTYVAGVDTRTEAACLLSSSYLLGSFASEL